MKKKTPNINDQMLSAMREDSNKWNFIAKVIHSEKESINKNILDKMDDEGHPLNEKQIFDLITWYQFLDYVENLPEMIIGESRPKPKQVEPNFEVYDTPLGSVREQITSS